MKKGFTLIELLAVIVILAIIAVITVPKVAEMIDSSREGAAQDAFYGSIKSAELGWAKALERDKILLGTECTFSSEGAVSCLNSNVEISSSGKNASSGKITLDANGAAEVYAEDSLLFNGYYCCGTSSKTYCKRDSVPEVSETNGICKSAGGGSGGSGAASMLIDKVVTTGDGLYIDPVEENRYVYRGGNPDNYIWLDLNGDTTKTDNETYRIVAIGPDNTIKVVAQNSLGNIIFDPGYNVALDGVTSSSSTEGTRYSSTSTDYCYTASNKLYQYYGCGVWGSKTTMLDVNGNNVTRMPIFAGSTTLYGLPTNEAYINTYLNTTFLNGINSSLQNKIATHTFDVGISNYNKTQSLTTDIYQEKQYTWNGKIGLITATDYVRASSNSSCTSIANYVETQCYTNSVTHNYLFHSVAAWTISPSSAQVTSDNVWYISLSGQLYPISATHQTNNVYPSFFLASDITLSGEGTPGIPYEIVS